MVSFPNCKINIGLRVLGKRADGFHNIETLFFPLPLKDILEINRDESQASVEFSQTGMTIPAVPQQNICVQAWELLKKDFPRLPGIKMHLHKLIPIGAGLGGGSADAAFALLSLNKLFDLGLSEGQLLQYALLLGSDCPFFLLNKPAYATGRGEQLTQLSMDLSAYTILLVNPGIHIDTGRAFAELDPGRPMEPSPLKEWIQQPVPTWKDQVSNDFELPVFRSYPEIQTLKEALYNNGAIYASLSGSGSSVFGLFEKGEQPLFNFPALYFYRWV